MSWNFSEVILKILVEFIKLGPTPLSGISQLDDYAKRKTDWSTRERLLGTKLVWSNNIKGIIKYKKWHGT